MFRQVVVLAVFALAVGAARADPGQPLAFGVSNQRSPQLTAQYWNPILEYVSKRSGVPLSLRMGKTALETTAMTVRGDFDFVFSNHLFTPERDKLGFRVIARPANSGICGEIVVLDESKSRTLADLAGKEVAFPSPEAFVAYWVVYDALLKARVDVTPVFAGNQEGAMGQLRVAAVAAAGVNSAVMNDYGQRESVRYRVLWSSEKYLDLPIMAHPRVAPDKVEAVRAALVGMAQDAEGRRILEASAEAIRQKPPLGFVAADNKDYDNYRRYYRHTLVKSESAH